MILVPTMRGEFEICGARYFQWDDGSIEMNKDSYIQRISPVEIPKFRRQEPQSSLTALELDPTAPTDLWQSSVCFSSQAATHFGQGRELQSVVNCGRVEHLLTANRVLFEAKSHPLSTMIVPIWENQVTFCAFSDASFETGKGRATRQGTIIFTTDGKLEENVKTLMCPMAWSSKKIPQVVRSTLSAESVAL